MRKANPNYHIRKSIKILTAKLNTSIMAELLSLKVAYAPGSLLLKYSKLVTLALSAAQKAPGPPCIPTVLGKDGLTLFGADLRGDVRRV